MNATAEILIWVADLVNRKPEVIHGLLPSYEVELFAETVLDAMDEVFGEPEPMTIESRQFQQRYMGRSLRRTQMMYRRN